MSYFDVARSLFTLLALSFRLFLGNTWVHVEAEAVLSLYSGLEHLLVGRRLDDGESRDLRGHLLVIAL